MNKTQVELFRQHREQLARYEDDFCDIEKLYSNRIIKKNRYSVKHKTRKMKEVFNAKNN